MRMIIKEVMTNYTICIVQELHTFLFKVAS